MYTKQIPGYYFGYYMVIPNIYLLLHNIIFTVNVLLPS